MASHYNPIQPDRPDSRGFEGIQRHVVGLLRAHPSRAAFARFLLRYWSVHTPPRVRIRIIHMLVHDFAFLLIQLPRVAFWQLIQHLLNRQADEGARLLPLAPIEHKLLAFEGVEQIVRYSLDLLLFPSW